MLLKTKTRVRVRVRVRNLSLVIRCKPIRRRRAPFFLQYPTTVPSISRLHCLGSDKIPFPLIFYEDLGVTSAPFVVSS